MSEFLAAKEDEEKETWESATFCEILLRPSLSLRALEYPTPQERCQNSQLGLNPLVNTVLSLPSSWAGNPQLDAQPRIRDDHVVDDVVGIPDPRDLESLQAVEGVDLAGLLGLEVGSKEGGPGGWDGLLGCWRSLGGGSGRRRGRSDESGLSGLSSLVDVSESEEGSEGLSGMVEVRKSVDDWDLGVSGESFDFRVRSDSSHDSVDHGSEHAGRGRSVQKGRRWKVRIGL